MESDSPYPLPKAAWSWAVSPPKARQLRRSVSPWPQRLGTGCPYRVSASHGTVGGGDGVQGRIPGGQPLTRSPMPPRRPWGPGRPGSPMMPFRPCRQGPAGRHPQGRPATPPRPLRLPGPRPHPPGSLGRQGPPEGLAGPAPPAKSEGKCEASPGPGGHGGLSLVIWPSCCTQTWAGILGAVGVLPEVRDTLRPHAAARLGGGNRCPEPPGTVASVAMLPVMGTWCRSFHTSSRGLGHGSRAIPAAQTAWAALTASQLLWAWPIEASSSPPQRALGSRPVCPRLVPYSPPSPCGQPRRAPRACQRLPTQGEGERGCRRACALGWGWGGGCGYLRGPRALLRGQPRPALQLGPVQKERP